MAYEEPAFELIQQNDVYDIRLYPERLVAQVIYGEEDSGFGTLFQYISGANRTGDDIAMTIPVTQSVDIEMTAPVTQSTQGQKSVMRFSYLVSIPLKQCLYQPIQMLKFKPYRLSI